MSTPIKKTIITTKKTPTKQTPKETTKTPHTPTTHGTSPLQPEQQKEILQPTKEVKKFPTLLMITIVLLFSQILVGTYVWIHHQTITEIEEKTDKNQNQATITPKQIEELENKLKEKIDQTQNNSQEELLSNPTQSTDDENYMFEPANPEKFLSFDKLIGFKNELKAAEGFLDYLKNKDNYQGIGEIEPPLGILMYGCPGTGKTTLARALAKETNLPFFEVSSSLFSQKFKGVAPQMVKDLFEIARNVAEENNGAIIFLDECETIFTDLATLEAGSEIANTVNQFKTEMTSMENNPEKPIFIIGATNHEDQIDEAIKSRFTFNIEVKPGTKSERKQFLEFMIKKRKNPYSDEAKTYLLEVINESLEFLPEHQQFLKANRTLENLLKATVNNFAKNRGQGETKRNAINIEDLKQAYKMIISQDTEILEKIENQKKGGE
ncbi:MAG: ATP-dependent Zn protease [Candidatus Phytoplasma solani]